MKMKRIMAGMTCVFVIGALAACSSATKSKSLPETTGSQSATSDVRAEGTVGIEAGGWSINREVLDISRNPEAEGAFGKATGLLDGVDYEPIALLGTQTVAGTNYCILSKASAVRPDAEVTYVLMYVYEDLDGNSEVTNIYDLGNVSGINGNTDGSFSFNQGDVSLDSNEDVKAAFENATAGSQGISYEAVGYLASQSVAGTNYCILSRIQSSADSAPELCMIFIYEDLEGNAGITETTELDIASLADESEVSVAGMPDPFEEAGSLIEAAGIVGFEITVPEATIDHPDRIIRIMGREMVEVLYVNKANETGEGTDEGYRIRKAAGVNDISGDYNEYGNNKTELVGDFSVTIKGNSGTWSVAIWSHDGYTYAVDAQDNPLSLEKMTEIISVIK